MPTLYHTCASKKRLRKAARLAPSITHGTGAVPARVAYDSDFPWFLDNGAYGAWRNGREWDPSDFRHALDLAEGRDRDPEFVVVPDVPGDGAMEGRREWVSELDHRGFSPYIAVHEPEPGLADLPDAVDGVLLGGVEHHADRDWRLQPDDRGVLHLRRLTETAHDLGLSVHVGRPGDRIAWFVNETAVDSLDTCSITRRGRWSRLKRIATASGQTPLSAF